MKSDEVYLKHILESTELIESFIKELTKKDFLINSEKQDAVIRRLEIIGEAVKNISTPTKKNHPKVAWREIAGTRDILIHSYFSVDLNLTWDIVKHDIPKLKKTILKILDNSSS